MIKLLLLVFISQATQAQTTAEIVSQVSLDTLIKTVRELSGEDSTDVNGNRVRIVHRVSKRGNDLSADYIVQKFNSWGIDVFEHNYRNGGRNILGTIKGKTNPDSIYIICAHYDAVADYCADDNASGVAAILEAARLLSTECFDNTVVFALWDEEERGLIGSKYYANFAQNRGDIIKAVLNMDMLGYDSDSNHVFDIHTNSIPHNQVLKDTLVYLVDTLNLTLVPQIMNPGTNRSDHAAFWQKGIPAVFFGESFLGGDPTPFYHTSGDRISTFNIPYFHNLSKLAVAVITEYAGLIPDDQTVHRVQACEEYTYKGLRYTESGLYSDTMKNFQGCDSIHTLDLTIINIDDSVSRDDRVLTAIDSTASYQWIDCNSAFTVLWGDTLQSYTVNMDGAFAVELTKEGCKDTSECFDLNVSNVPLVKNSQFKIYPNPNDGTFMLDWEELSAGSTLEIYDAQGALVYNKTMMAGKGEQVKTNLQAGLYTLLIKSENSATYQRFRVW